MSEISYIDYKRLTQNWIRNLLTGMDHELSAETRSRLLEACGRACARGDGQSPASQCKGDLDRFLSAVRVWNGGEDTAVRDGDTVMIMCKQCMCPIVGDDRGEVSGAYCDCSLGWMKENFETILGKPVAVEVAETIRRGATACRFVIHI